MDVTGSSQSIDEAALKDLVCANCFYWEPVRARIGECRRDTPIAGEDFEARWPLTRAIDWCGEHAKPVVV